MQLMLSQEQNLKLAEEIDELGDEQAIEFARAVSDRYGLEWTVGIATVFREVCENAPQLAPSNIRRTKDGVNAIEKWVLKYWRGFEGRASQRASNPPGTIPDPVIEEIIGARLVHLSEDDLSKITFAHRLGMSAENILGVILEEYLAIRLAETGWHCAWGETAKSVDFVNEDGRLLQIKNRSNSENSSSSRVRDGTEIEKWYRVEANKKGIFHWEKLNRMCGIDTLSEENFVEFVKSLLGGNPEALAVETDNPWK